LEIISTYEYLQSVRFKIFQALNIHVGFEVLTAVVMKSYYIFWNITPCSLFASCFQAYFLLDLFFNPEDGGMSLPNVG
jgi:hypothetical protein